MRKIIILSFVIVLLGYLMTCNFPSNLAKKLDTVNIEKLKKAIETLDQDPYLQHGQWSFSLRKAKTGEVILEHNAQKTLNVASCMKAITTAAGLEILGENFRYKTEIQYDGQISNGTLKGNVYIKGGGDPTLGSTLMSQNAMPIVLSQWIQALQRLGIQTIEGDIIADEEMYLPNVIPSGWMWEDMGNYYGAPAMALNIYDNTYKLYFEPAQEVGNPAKLLKTEPYIPYLFFHNEMLTGEANSGDNGYIYGTIYDYQRWVGGTVPKGGTFSIKGSIPDPAMLCATQMSEYMRKSGFTITGKATTTRLLKKENKTINTNRTSVHTHLSPPLREIANWTNFYSVNLYAEAILKMIGLQTEGKAGTLAGTKAITRFWKDKQIDTEGFYMKDGSGLSLANGITASQMTAMFAKLTQLNTFQAFYASLPVAGVSGTMQGVGVGTRLVNNLRAKTGAMTRIQAYTGYLTAVDGELLCFSIVVNQYSSDYTTMRKKIEGLLVTILEP